MIALAAALALSAATSGPAGAEAPKRALIVTKVLSYERRLAESKGTSVGIAIVYADSKESRASADAWAREFAELGDTQVHGVSLDVIKLPFDRSSVLAAIRTRGIDVLLACVGVPPAAVSSLSREVQVLSASDTRAGVEQGLAFTVLVGSGKNQIVINLGAAKDEGARFSTRLLQVAEVL